MMGKIEAIISRNTRGGNLHNNASRPFLRNLFPGKYHEKTELDES